MTSDYFTSQDLTQDTFLAAFRHLQSVSKQNEKNWLCRIATNKCIDHLKSAKQRSSPTDHEKLDQYECKEKTPEIEALENDARKQLIDRCQSLRPPYDTIACRYFYNEETPHEISEALGINIKTVQTQIYRAREMLRAIYREDSNREETAV